jgi:NADPH:quinone reductase-like Zn-dependent oxidoreductase
VFLFLTVLCYLTRECPNAIYMSQLLTLPLLVGTPYALLGCDAAGIVVEVGSKVTKDWKVGDRIAGGAHGGMIHLQSHEL